MPKIYISYRPDDSQSITDRIYDKLVAEFGAENIFRDISSIPAGKDRHDQILKAIVTHPIMLVIIGQNWLEAKDKHGDKAILDKDDQIRIEVETGLRSDETSVIPVLVESATVPESNRLPHNLITLANKSPMHVRGGNDFENDIQKLIDHLKSISLSQPQVTPQQQAIDDVKTPPNNKESWLNEHSTAIIVALIGGIFAIIAALIGIVPDLIGDDDTETPFVQATNTPTSEVVPSVTSTVDTSEGTIDPSPTNPVISPPPITTTQTPPLQTGTITIIRGTNSWIVYIPVGEIPVSIEGLRFEAVDREPTALSSYISFQGVNFGGLTASTCFVIYHESYVSPQQCNNIDNNNFHSAQISDSDIFWYDTVRNSARPVAVYLGDQQLGICPNNASCEMDLSNGN